MGKDDYTASAGGPLKLKGAKGSGIDKKHKKKKKKPLHDPVDSASATDLQNASHASDEGEGATERMTDESKSIDKAEAKSGAAAELEAIRKTAAEKRYDEIRRRRLDERIRREGTKTHKERVEELNKYLSNLSEHHDMPRIGPG